MKRFASIMFALCVITGVSLARAGVLSDAPAEPSPLALKINNTISAGKISVGLTIVNTSDHAVTIQRGIELDKVDKFRWSAQMMIQAVADCDAYDHSRSWRTPVRIEPGAELPVVPWHGWSCGEKRQCPEACGQTAPMGPGNYQFVVVTAEGRRISSAPFTLPAP